jgi:GT2 family glycosyltransferase
MQLSIIIINFNTFQLTVDCIRSIQKNITSINYEIIVVDNAPKEDYQKAFCNLFPSLIYLRSDENIGFGRANNLGVTKANGKYILFINSDTLVLDNSLELCYQFMESDSAEEIGVLGCRLMNEDLSFQPSFYPFRRNSIGNYLLSNNYLINKLFRVNERFKETNDLIEVGDVSGAFMFMRKKVIEDVGGFDPDFFLYCEETEWCRERISKQYKIVYYPTAAIIHLGGKSAPKEPMYIQSKLSLALLWYKKGWISYCLYLLFSHVNLLSHLLLLPFVQQASKKNILNELKSSFKIIPYLFSDVIKYQRGFGSRKESLIYEGARTIFFGSNKQVKD